MLLKGRIDPLSLHLPRSIAVLGQNEEFQPDVHFVGPLTDPKRVRFIETLIGKHDRGIVKHYVYCPMPNVVSVELEFGKSEEERSMMRACLEEYEESFEDNCEIKASVLKQHEIAGPNRIILVRPTVPAEAVGVHLSDIGGLLKKYVGTAIGVLPYPLHLNCPLTLLINQNGINENGIGGRLAYNRWGIFGGFVVARFDRKGRLRSLSPEQVDAVIQSLQYPFDGLLNPGCGTLSVVSLAFYQTGTPPSGWVPAELANKS